MCHCSPSDEALGLGRKKMACRRIGEVFMRLLKLEHTRWLRSKVDGGRWFRMSSRSSGVENTWDTAEDILVVAVRS